MDGDYLDYSNMMEDMMMDGEEYPLDQEMMMKEGMIDPEMLQEYYGDDVDMYEYYKDLQGQMQENDQSYVRLPLDELLDKCIIPTMGQALKTVVPLAVLCLITRIIFIIGADDEKDKKDEDNNSTHSTRFSPYMLHLTSALAGLVAANLFFEKSVVYLICLAILSYSVIHVVPNLRPGTCGPILAGTTVIYLVSCELFGVDATLWHQIRGAQMILAMKAISVGFDIDSKQIVKPPNVLGFLGYIFHPGSIIFGPWVSYSEYADLRMHKHKKVTFWWFYKIMKSFLSAFCCVVISTCVVHWVFLQKSGRWVGAYADAQSFRFSNYFVGFLAEFTITLSGLGASRKNGEIKWDLAVSKPFSIELPRSLVEVVTNWNLPMHYWLKTYVFKVAKPLGNENAIYLTYFASAILHGLNFQLAAVLLSLGCYSYTEYMFRKRLAEVFDACIEAKRCKDCTHTYKSMHLGVIIANVMLGLLAMFHLAYLGLMFDSSDEQDKGYTMLHTIEKWAELDFLSHWIAFATYFLYQII